MTQQIETATVIGTITNPGNATVIVTSARMSNSPKTVSVAVLAGDTASVVASAIRTALAFDSDVSSTFLVSGTNANVVLTEHVAHANDSTLNISIDNGTCAGLTAAPTSTNTTAGVGLSNGYCTVAEVKEQERLNFSVTTFDTAIEGAIEAISRAIDNECGRFFYVEGADSTNYFVAKDDEYVHIGDYVSVTTLSTDNSGDRSYTDWTVDTDYDLWPYNAALDSKPYMRVDVAPRGGKRFYKGISKGVKVVGKRGWPAVPKPVHEACILWFLRAYKRYATPLGVSAMSALGEMSVKVPPPDPDVVALLSPYKLLPFG